MTEFNRSQFKGATLSSIKGEQERAEKALPKNDNFGNRPGFHTVEDGKNYRRIAPAHKPEQPAYRAKSSVFLECEVPELDNDGKETGKKEVKRKNIFIATQHSKTLVDDPINIYIGFVQKRANDEIQDKDERSKFLSPVNGWRGKDGKWNWGIRPSTEFICYAWDDKGVLGREQLFPYMLDSMKKISVERADDDAEIIPDIFTDPDEGYPLIITREKNDKGKYETTCSCDLPTKKESWPEFFARTRLTDEQLADLFSKESLSDLYEDVYTTRDFNMAIDGLQRFDKKYGYEIFENEDFIQKITELKRLVPEWKPKEVSEEPEKESPKHVEERESEASNDQPMTSAVPVPAMKRFLKEYIAENYGEDFSLPELDKDTLSKWYSLAKQGEELPFDEEQKENQAPHTTQPEKPAVKEDSVAQSEPPSDIADQIAALRRKRKTS
jgi:hypothetical protein